MPDDKIDPNQGKPDPAGQQNVGDEGNDGQDGGAGQAEDVIEISGVKIPVSELEKHEKLKSVFEDSRNKSKWQAENTKRSMEIAEERRLASEFRRLQADPRFQQMFSPQNQQPDLRKDFVSTVRGKFPDVDPNFLETLGDYMEKFAGSVTERSVKPLMDQIGNQFEQDFLAAHKDVIKGSQEYRKIGSLISSGVDPQEAYEFVFKDKIRSAEIETAIKKRDEDNRLKLKRQRQTGASGVKKTAGSMDETFEDVWGELADAN